MAGLGTIRLQTPSFLHGWASVFDLAATRAPRVILSADPVEADRRALESDWAAVDRDLRAAVACLREP